MNNRYLLCQRIGWVYLIAIAFPLAGYAVGAASDGLWGLPFKVSFFAALAAPLALVCFELMFRWHRRSLGKYVAMSLTYSVVAAFGPTFIIVKALRDGGF